jgi:lysozyme family protein/peptidoglycan hydrolase-like protein with peptidoglycan-binding domain
MQHPFAALEPEYLALMANMRVTRAPAVEATAARLMANVRAGRYKAVADELGIPQIFIATSFEREASSNFRLSPAQGDPIDRRSTHVPAGRGPFADWHAAAVDAYKLDHLDQVGKAGWTWARLCYEGEIFNGFGYRAHGVHSPYDWAGTNAYAGGKYIADHVFSMAAQDSQLGIVPVARAMVAADPALDIPGWPGAPLPPVPGPAPPPLGVGGDRDVGTLQSALNALGYGPLALDNNYGRRTRAAVAAFQKDHHLEADGLSGPLTYAALLSALKAKESPVTITTPAPTLPSGASFPIHLGGIVSFANMFSAFLPTTIKPLVDIPLDLLKIPNEIQSSPPDVTHIAGIIIKHLRAVADDLAAAFPQPPATG